MTARDTLNTQVTEKGLQQAVLDLAEMYGWLCYHTFDSRRSKAGFPDLVMIQRPTPELEQAQMIVVELKSATGQLSLGQHMWLRAFRLVPCIDTYVWRPSDWEAIVARLKQGRLQAEKGEPK